MAPVKEAFQSIVRFSSQDPIHRAENVLNQQNNKKWLSNKIDKNGRIEMEIHLSKAIRIAFVNIGNAGTAYIELTVGSSMWPVGTDYASFLPSTVLMSPQDSKTGQNSNCVKMLNKDSFCKNVSDQEWDRIQVICRQPFNKNKQFGLQFIDFIADDKPSSAGKQDGNALMTSPGQTLAQFKNMLSPSSRHSVNCLPSGGLLLSPPTPSRAAGLVQAALRGKNKPTQVMTTPTHRRNTSTKLKKSPYTVLTPGMQRRKTLSRSCAGDIEDEIECFLEGCKFEQMPLSTLECATYGDLKNKMEQQRGCPFTKSEKKIFLRLAEKAIEKVLQKHQSGEQKLREETVPDFFDAGKSDEEELPEMTFLDNPDKKDNNEKTKEVIDLCSPTTNEKVSTQSDDCLLVECPLCERFFSSVTVELHASTCTGSSVQETATNDIDDDACIPAKYKIEDGNTKYQPCETASVDFVGLDSATSDGCVCPVCHGTFPPSRIGIHASLCAEIHFALPPHISSLS